MTFNYTEQNKAQRKIDKPVGGRGRKNEERKPSERE